MTDLFSPTAAPFGNGDVFATSRLLRSVTGLVHGFSLRTAGDFSAGSAACHLPAPIGSRRVRLLRQVHGAAVARTSDSADRPAADAWAGPAEPGRFFGLLTADCVPVLLCHPPSRTLGLAHAGWRGAVQGIVGQTLKTMGGRAEEVKVALGPSIGPCCYQVGDDVARAVGYETPLVTPWGEEPGKYRLDLPGLVRFQLEAAGITPENEESLGFCTACRTDLFFSHRREGRTGRMVSFLGWLEDRA